MLKSSTLLIALWQAILDDTISLTDAFKLRELFLSYTGKSTLVLELI